MALKSYPISNAERNNIYEKLEAAVGENKLKTYSMNSMGVVTSRGYRSPEAGTFFFVNDKKEGGMLSLDELMHEEQSKLIKELTGYDLN